MTSGMRRRPAGRPGSSHPGRCAIGIMTKAPLPGRVKTRLTPPLSPAEAAALHACFLRDTAAAITAACAAGACEGAVVYTPAGSEAVFDALVPPEFHRVLQRGGTLGERLYGAAADLRDAGYAALCLVGSDSPTLSPAVFTEAAGLLARDPDCVVIGPADDGGYYLIGMTAPDPRLFAGIAWGTEAVFAQTLARAAEAGVRVEVLPRWYDVDDAPSLRRLCRECFDGHGGRGSPAPHTRRYLSQLLAHARERIWAPPSVTGERRGDRAGLPR